MKFYPISAGAGGMPAKMWIEIHNLTSDYQDVTVSFYDDQSAPPILDSFGYLVPDRQQVVIDGADIVIPENAKFVALATESSNVLTFFYRLEVQELPFVERLIDGTNFFLQNGYLAFATLQPNFYRHDLPARNVEINGAPTYVQGVQKNKKQDVEYPVPNEPNVNQLVKTNIGNGAIEKMSLTLHSRMAKTTLKYDTE